ncbi:U-box domain-containing protein 33 [Linum grandiflorum]
MAVMMSPATPITQLMNQPMSLVEFGGSRRMSSSSISSSIGEISPVARVIDEKIYVAVGKTFDKSKSAVVWALQNSGGKKICVLHVHQPAQMIPLLGAKFEASTLKEREVKAYRDIQRGKMHKVLAEYLRLCGRVGVRAEAMVIEKESIEEGILELISKHGIKKLVMGAADNSRYYKNMTNLKSKKAIFVKEQAPAACHIWFVCKSHLIHTRHAILHQDDESASSQPQGSSSIRTGNFSRSHSVYVKPSNPIQDLFKKAPSLNLDARFSGGREMLHTMPDGTRAVVTPPRSDAEESSYVNEPRRSTSHGSVLSSSSSGGMANLAIVPSTLTEGSDVAAEMSTFPEITDNLCHTSPPSVPEITVVDPLYEQLKRTMEESIFSEREALEEATRRAKAEKNTIEAIHRANALEALYSKELKQRKETEEMLGKEKEDHRRTKNQRDEERLVSIGKIVFLEVQVGTLENEVKELQDTVLETTNQCTKFEKERDELQEELQTKLAEHASTLQLLTMFSLAEIDEATDGFNESNKIGVGGYGTIYKGFICHTAVAVKVLNRDSMQGAAEFQQEVNVLGKLRHPNLVTLIGACQESYALIYEYMPNGNLEDRLNCKNDTPPLPWQARIRLATELCSVLIFLHSSKPNSIVHGDLKPANILLDANLGCKLSDFGICRALAPPGSGNNATLFHITDPKGTFHYLDPHFLTTGELSPKSDTYSFGIILLQLLSGKPALGIANETRLAMNEGSLSFLDQSAGDWPFLQAKQLARLGLACCDMDRSRRPDLASDVRRVLERMRGLWVSSSLTWSGSRHQPPSHFYCPILQDVMVDPHVAADGFTYEVEALRGWFEGGHVTSPMTNLELDNFDLVPNRSLRSAIQEWLQR